jgi:alkylhydroperoxidase/carboxymuconolactone decarboxylase family protein YurZ
LQTFSLTRNGANKMSDWPQATKDVTVQLRNLRADAPEVMRAFSQLAQAATGAKALDAKTKELIALGIAVAVRCDDCIGTLKAWMGATHFLTRTLDKVRTEMSLHVLAYNVWPAPSASRDHKSV